VALLSASTPISAPNPPLWVTTFYGRKSDFSSAAASFSISDADFSVASAIRRNAPATLMLAKMTTSTSTTESQVMSISSIYRPTDQQRETQNGMGSKPVPYETAIAATDFDWATPAWLDALREFWYPANKDAHPEGSGQ
jgi:hypothetical protein